MRQEDREMTNKKREMLPGEIAYSIAEKAHSKQRRVNGDYYFTHPLGMFDYYRDLVLNSLCPYKWEAMKDNDIPTDGVPEVILLHDVIEDTEVTHEDIRKTFYDREWGEYFDKYISEPLKLITHDKKEDYETYIEKVMRHPVSAFVKMIDLINNLDLLRLATLGDYEYDRALRYVKCFKMINDRYHYVEKLFNYLADIRQ